MLNIEDREEDVTIDDVEVVKVLFFDWSAGLVFMLIDEACTVASFLNMITDHAQMASESRTS
jgi:hypothetical protein